MGEYRIRKTETGYVFHLRANNRQGIGVSQVYVSLNGCKRGTESIRKNCKSKIEDQTLQTPEVKTHPKYEVYLDKAGAFRFRLKASNGQNVLASQAYTTKSACMNGIESVMNHAPDAIVVVVEFDEKQEDDELFDEVPVATPVVKEERSKPESDDVASTEEEIDETPEEPVEEEIDDVQDESDEIENVDSIESEQDILTAEEEEIIEDEAEDELRSGMSEDSTVDKDLEEEEFVTDIEEGSGTESEASGDAAEQESEDVESDDNDGAPEATNDIAEQPAGSKRKSKWKLIRKDIFWYFRKHKKR